MKVTLSEIKKDLQETNNGVVEAKNQINDSEHTEEKKKFNQNSKKKKNPKNKDMLRSLWDNFKCTNIWIIRVPKGEEKEQEIENLFEK